MRVFLFALSAVLFAFVTGEEANAKIWAVLVAGSDGYYNYRHQSDVCHAYQILKRHGIPDERIIVLMKDDIAYNEQNPTPGIIVNHLNGSNVYPGVPKDYTGKLVTPENFIKILKGEDVQGGSGKKLNSGPDDHVFLNFVDHGASGILAFPDGELTVKQLIQTLNYMHTHQRYGKLVFYVEACESGSMFLNHLPDNIDIYATTASNAVESSYACYYDSLRETYLGDWYSVHWMEDSDKEDLQKETIEKQYEITKEETKTSHVQEFGDEDIAKLFVSEFQGRKDVTPITYPQVVNPDLVESWDVPLAILRKRIASQPDPKKRSDLKRELKRMVKNRKALTKMMKSVITGVTTQTGLNARFLDRPEAVQDLDCHHSLVTHFSQNCLSFAKHPFAMKYAYVLTNLCNEGVALETSKTAVDSACAQLPKGEVYA